MFAKIGSLKTTARDAWSWWTRYAETLGPRKSTIIVVAVPMGLMITVLALLKSWGLPVGIDDIVRYGGVILIGVSILVPEVCLRTIEKIVGKQILTGWKRFGSLAFVRVAALCAAAIWVECLHLTPLTYTFWVAVWVVLGLVLHNLAKGQRRRVWAGVVLALALPWTFLCTFRTLDVTIKGANVDPEVGAWNVSTDLKSHWARMFFLRGGTVDDPTRPGVILLNRDIPLLGHRQANAFHDAFSHLVGQKVRVKTIGVWWKAVGLQPTIISYEVHK